MDYGSACDEIIGAAREKRPLTATALAVHGVMTGVLDRQHRHRLNALDLVLPDGQPVRWALNMLFGTALTDRVYGPNLMLRVCERAAAVGLSVGFYGNREEVLDDLRHRLLSWLPGLRISLMMPSRFRRIQPNEQSEIAAEILASGVDVLFVGLGCPRQEVWLYEHRHLLNMPMIAVGAAFDFHAGRLAQAPRWMQDRGLEWVFRFLHEPRRLWRRYMLLNPLFVMLLALQYLGVYRLRRSLESATVQYEGFA
jgi:N-acetylglucosaminyldiphosphoundecaprenol N-acetyl-beta-D-mannosaminyltransferase